MATQPFESLRQAVNRADPNALADIFRLLAGGDVLRALPVYLRNQLPVAAVATQLATLSTIVLPEDAKAAVIHRCTVRTTSSAAVGEYTVQAYGTTPSTTQVAVAPNGDIVFLTTDGVTSVDVIYTPQKGDVLGQLAYSNTTQTAAGTGTGITSLNLAAPAGIATIPAPWAGKAILLMNAVATAGTNTGSKNILVPAAGVVATTKAALSQDGTKVYFNFATDAVTACTVDLLVASGTGGGADVNALLEGASSVV